MDQRLDRGIGGGGPPRGFGSIRDRRAWCKFMAIPSRTFMEGCNLALSDACRVGCVFQDARYALYRVGAAGDRLNKSNTCTLLKLQGTVSIRACMAGAGHCCRKASWTRSC